MEFQSFENPLFYKTERYTLYIGAVHKRRHQSGGGGLVKKRRL